jgi:hypothetical protein
VPLGLAACTTFERWGADLFAVPSTNPSEAYAPAGEAADHQAFTALLSRVVTPDGWVRYDRLVDDPTPLNQYLDQLGELDFDALSRDHKLAALINAYNAFTLQLIVDHHPVASIQDIPSKERWEARRWNLGGTTTSLNDLEHRMLRQNFLEPRIHFAINCASVGCPPLASEAFEGATVDAQLDRAGARIHTPGSRWFELQTENEKVKMAVFRVYLWFHGDFERVSGSVAAFAGRYVPSVRAALNAGRSVDVEYLPYDWGLNVAPRPT